jgi:HEAT repeat protein
VNARTLGPIGLCLTIASVFASSGHCAVRSSPVKVKGKKVSRWVKQLQHQNRGLQMRARRALAEAERKQIPVIIPELIPLLSAERQNTRAPVAQVLGEYGPSARAAVPRLLPMLEGTQYERNRSAAARALGQILKDAEPCEEVEKVTQALIRVFGDKYEDVRRESVEACGRIGPAAKSCIPHLVPRLGERSFAVSSVAAWATGRMGKLAACHIDRLISMLQSSRNVATTVLYAIGEIGPVHENVIPNLVDRLEKVAAGGGFRVGAVGWRVGEITRGSKSEYVEYCFKTLARFGPKSAVAVPLMQRFISQGRWSGRRNIQYAVGALKVLAAVGPAAKAALPAVKKTFEVKGFDRRISKQTIAAFKKARQAALAALSGK